jgi:hypothetical protein
LNRPPENPGRINVAAAVQANGENADVASLLVNNAKYTSDHFRHERMSRM